MKAKKKVKESDLENIGEFIAEAGLLKRVIRSGWSVVGIQNAESVADHSFRCAVIGFVLAEMEKANVEKVLLMTLFGDIHEARITDLHKMAQRYFDTDKAEDTAFKEQIQSLPKTIKTKLKDSRDHYRGQESLESIIARDADILECLIQAREYVKAGYANAVEFTKLGPRHLKTASARQLWQWAKKADLNEWWRRLSEFKR